MSYLAAGPLTDKQKLNYRVTIDASGKEETIELQLDRTNTESFAGEVVLLHGFRASKEFMVNSALYFRFLGFDVLIPDLLGHGESNGQLGFGVRDSELLNEFLNQKNRINYPLLVVGNSMGAVAAVSLAAKRRDISGLILQAPMIPFDRAAVNYVNSYAPFLSSFMSDDTIRAGAIKAMNDASVAPAQTDIKLVIPSLNIPILLLASTEDPVAPFTDFESLRAREVAVVNMKNRSHPSMAVIGQQDDQVIQRWLTSKANRWCCGVTAASE